MPRWVTTPSNGGAITPSPGIARQSEPAASEDEQTWIIGYQLLGSSLPPVIAFALAIGIFIIDTLTPSTSARLRMVKERFNSSLI